jgi:hypothetical protein
MFQRPIYQERWRVTYTDGRDGGRFDRIEGQYPREDYEAFVKRIKHECSQFDFPCALFSLERAAHAPKG